MCDDLIAAATQTGRTSPLSACNPALYAGGRVDIWYLRHDLTVTDTHTGDRIPVGALTRYTAIVNGTVLPLDIPAALNAARAALHPDSRWPSAITQGDPTEPNIATSAAGACWLDFEYAGRNTLAGEAANLPWYLLAFGGWLVPTYQPDVDARTLHLPPAATPTAEHAEQSTHHRRLDLHAPGRPAQAATPPSPDSSPASPPTSATPPDCLPATSSDHCVHV
ncbi:hypothetical protein OG259_41050 [Streptomyces sp. NBC_00250]|uniref:hypothetical protein n=1 Tax=Streptomyces sp. NBC_00250 TaxID=2903641 RepID=UPI002E2C9961|nr:hypothetical protein [Streptomyces sp. NBC_00250]